MTKLRPRRHRGVVLLMVVVALAVATLLGGTLVRWAAMEHRLLRLREQESQARWLAEAALERAAARLAADEQYTGEIWSLAASELPERQTGRVEIAVTKIDGEPQRRITVEASYPRGRERSVRIRKTVVFHSGRTGRAS